MINFTLVSFDIYWYYPLFILIFIFLLLNGFLNKIDLHLFIILSSILIFSIFNNYILYASIIKQWINLTFFFLFSYSYLKYINFDFIYFFDRYFLIAKIFILFGFFQMILFSFNLGEYFHKFFSFLTIPGSITNRFQSIDREPSFSAYTLMPAFFVSTFNLWYKKNVFLTKNWSILFLVAYFFTFSLIAYVGILVIFLFYYFREMLYVNFNKFIFLALIILPIFYAIYKRPDINLRVNDSIKVLVFDVGNVSKINSSTYALYSNFLVTKSGFYNNSLFGSGIGTHENNFNKYIPKYLNNITVINSKEAASLFLRLLSEGGGVSLFLFLYFLQKFRIGYSLDLNDIDLKLYLFNNGIFLMILLRLIRQGHYTVSGLPIFILIFYYSFLKYSKHQVF